MYEQRIQRSWSLNPRELWTVMRTQANRHINGVDTTNIVGSFEQQGLDFVQYAVGNSGTTPGTFAANIRNELGLPEDAYVNTCLLYTSPSPRDRQKSRMPSSA